MAPWRRPPTRLRNELSHEMWDLCIRLAFPFESKLSEYIIHTRFWIPLSAMGRRLTIPALPTECLREKGGFY